MRDQGIYLEHILECIGRVQRYTAGGLESLVADQMVQDAVMRNLQVLAESCMRMSSEIRDRRKEIDWRGISAFRNVIVHDYLDLDWQTKCRRHKVNSFLCLRNRQPQRL